MTMNRYVGKWEEFQYTEHWDLNDCIIDKMMGQEMDLEKALSRNEKMSSLEEEVQRLRAENVGLKSGSQGSVFLQPIGAGGLRPPGSVKKNIRRTTIVKKPAEER